MELTMGLLCPYVMPDGLQRIRPAPIGGGVFLLGIVFGFVTAIV